MQALSPQSLQGQFTSHYFTGSQSELIAKINEGLSRLGEASPYSMGTTIPINTHGKTFYFTVMADLNKEGNAFTTVENVKQAMNGLWSRVRTAGELQELAVPLIGTGRGRLQMSRKRMISLIARSFEEASEKN
ncbi:macro domain-containing protein [Natribacillus halophilus]|uniref:Thoeris protein ThsA Macro domain-containing protein n=1 Tax=Natribacillus halophilus TaxID=549003 RepID=A0A1G8KF49_9BACI|nr:macro domain-containing protein [Natribacillus halophilus]SDI42037.1 hypothetical protein SAMN04488123_10265 [Natribacillus halophilus]